MDMAWVATMADWDSMDRVTTQTLGRAFDFLLSLQKLGRVFGKFLKAFKNKHSAECFVKESF